MRYSLDDNELYLFNEGTNAFAYRALGAHYAGDNAWRFAVWAPNAAHVALVGDFNGWRPQPMLKLGGGGVWQTHVTGDIHGWPYKYEITTAQGEKLLKADPYAFYSELRPGTASKVFDVFSYGWRDAQWMERRKSYRPYDKPVSIYEVHLPSWRGEKNYRDLAAELVPYVKEMGFTHVEFMPVAEYPLDASWGYQTTGFYSASARGGNPHDFMYLVDELHLNGIGVIVDWVSAHFPKDAQGLRRFDGTPCYEYGNPLEGEQPQWGTLLFNYSRTEVVSFMLSNAVFWADVYHVDGLRADAVSCMIYRDYGREKYQPNAMGGRENLEAIAFLQRCSSTLFELFPGFIFAAEESTTYPRVTGRVERGGLGFNYKWNMGWMNDVLEYMKADCLFRKYCHNKLTFSMHYAFSENFILPLSHDEVVHGKKSLIGRMPGDYWQKFANLRLLFSYMFAHPGKKLLFMGSEIGQFIEWRYYEPIEWKLLAYDMHRNLREFVAELNRFYAEAPELYEKDGSWDGFEWQSADNSQHSIVTFVRKGAGGALLCVFNFTPVAWEDYKLGVSLGGEYIEVLNSDEARFGGSGVVNSGKLATLDEGYDGKPYTLAMRIPPLGGVYMRFENTRQ